MIRAMARRGRLSVGVLLVALVALVASSQVASARPTPSASNHTVVSQASNANLTVTVTDDNWTDSANAAAIPLGDNDYVTTPETGHLDSCETTFSTTGGATSSGSWLDSAAGTWDSETKLAVEGSVKWKKATYTVKNEGQYRVIKTADLPKGQTTGSFPIATSDPAYQYDHNPNQIERQSLT